MALNRQPSASQVNGSSLLVKDADVTTGLYSNFLRVPGFVSWTLPDETGSTTETQLMDGTISFSQIAGVGTVTGSLGSLSGHATHELLSDKRRNGGNIQAVIVRPAILAGSANGQGAGTNAAANGTTGFSVVTVPASAAAEAKGLIREGRLVTVDSAVDADTVWSSVLKANELRETVSGTEDAGAYLFQIEPGYGAATSGNNNRYYVRQAGFLVEPFTCTVNGFGDGDFQAGSAITANISLAPSQALSIDRKFSKLSSEMGSDYDGAFSRVS